MARSFLRVVSVAMAVSACSGGSGGSGGGGGSDGGGGSGGTSGTSGSSTSGSSTGSRNGVSVLGTRHGGTCDDGTYGPFVQACEAEGGILGDHCQGAACQWGATCYAPPPAPSPGQFACDGLFLCDEGSMCVIDDPSTDGCFEHGCEAIPSGCAADPSCECLEPLVGPCTLDADGNPTVRRYPSY